MTYSKLL